MQPIFLRILLKRIKAIKYFLKDKSVPKRRKLIIVLGILYLIMPVDLVPEPILLVGIIDDIVLWSFLLWYLKDELDKYWLGDDAEVVEKKYRGKNIIDDVNFEVEKEEEK